MYANPWSEVRLFMSPKWICKSIRWNEFTELIGYSRASGYHMDLLLKWFHDQPSA